MNDRIRQLRKALGLSQQEFAARIGRKQSAVSYLEKSGSTVTEQNIKAICSQFSASETWLRTGSGGMFVPGEGRKKELLEAFGQLAPSLQDYLVKSARALLEAQRGMSADGEGLPLK